MSGSTSSSAGNSFAQEIANYVSQNPSNSAASISAAAANFGSQLAASYISAGAQGVGSFLGGLGSSSSAPSTSSSSSTGGINLSALIQEGISQFAPQLSSASTGSSSSGSSSLSSLISSGIQANLPAGLSVSGSTVNFPAISTPLGTFNASFQNGTLSVMPSSSS